MDEPLPRRKPGDEGYNQFWDEVGLPWLLDRQGNPISMRQFGELHASEDYVRVAADHLDDGQLWVSTVWLGLDHGFGSGPPLTFETMVFVHLTEEQIEARRRQWATITTLDPGRFPWEESMIERYSTEDEARDGHRKIVDTLRVNVEEFYHALHSN
jgi:hypothetical protein